MGDVLRVGRLLSDLDYLDSNGDLTEVGVALLANAMKVKGVGESGIKNDVRRLLRWMRRIGLVAPANPDTETERVDFVDKNSGEEMATTRLVEIF